MSNTYGAPPPNPLTSSLLPAGGIGMLNPGAQQAQQTQQLTAQQVKQAQEMANLLQKQGQESGKYTSPWQAAAQWVSALKGRMKQDQVNDYYRQLDALGAPSPQQPSAPGAPPSPGGDQSFPWRGGQQNQSQTPPAAQSSANQEAAAVNAGTWQPAPDYAAGLALAQPSLQNPPPGGPTLAGAPGATYSQIMGGS